MIDLTLNANLIYIYLVNINVTLTEKQRHLFHTYENPVSFNTFLTCLVQFILLGKNYNIIHQIIAHFNIVSIR